MTFAVPSGLRRRIRQPIWQVADAVARPTARLRDLPDYVIAGAQRASTTSLQEALTKHPAVGSPRLKKGVHYFDSWFHRGPEWYRSQFPTRATRRFRETIVGTTTVVGEASPYYMFHPAVPGRIAETLPGGKIIVVLRNPIERAISHHSHEVRRGYETVGLLDALRRESERLMGEEERLLSDPLYQSHEHRHHSYVGRGMYADQLERLYRFVPAARVHVVHAELLWTEPEDTLKEVFRFLGVPQYAGSRLGHRNATPRRAPNSDAREYLAEIFESPNQRLDTLLDRTFGWE